MNKEPSQQIEIYTDGGCEPNPGAGGYGVVLLHPRKRAEASSGFRLITSKPERISFPRQSLKLRIAGTRT